MNVVNDALLQNIYLFPLLVALAVWIGYMVFSQRLKYDPKFANEFSNRLYALSFVKPFSFFVISDEEHPRVKKVERIIRRARLDHILNYRALVSFQVLLLIVGAVLYLFLFFFIEYVVIFLDFIFRIKEPTVVDLPTVRLLIALILGLVLLIPGSYIERRAKKNEFQFRQELSVVQMSIILMLRAKRPLNEILYSLARTQTQYRDIFEKAYRKFLRDKKDCWDYLRFEFEGTDFVATVGILENIDNYSREETIYVLEQQLETIIRNAEEDKRKQATFGNLFSQFSMAIPFLGVGLLGAVPFAMYIFSMITEHVSQTSLF